MTSKVRRDSSRNRTKKQSSTAQRRRAREEEEYITSSTSWFGEVLAFLAATLSVFLIASILSLEYSLQNLYSDTSQILHPLQTQESPTLWNIMGPVGHVIGTISRGLFGWCALAPALWLVWLSYSLWVWDEEEPFLEDFQSYISIIVGLVVSQFFACSLFALFGGEDLGGAIGMFLAGPLENLFGFWGAMLLFVACLVPALTYALHMTIGELFLSSILGVKTIIVSTPAVLFWIAEKIWENAIWCLAHIVTSGPFQFLLHIPALFSRDSYEYEDDEEEEEFLPKPRKRKNKIEDEELEDDEQYEYDDEERYEVVVERRSTLKRASKKDIRLARKKIAATYVGEEDLKKFAQYEPPTLDLLKPGELSAHAEDDESLKLKSRLIEEKLRDFNIRGKVTHVHPGPVITLFEFEPAPGVKVGRIAALQDDLAMSLRASSLRIIAPIPQKGTVGIEVPNRNHDIVRLRDVLESEEFIKADSSLSVPLGKDTYGNPVVVDIASMPHVLMAGATGTGKSVAINALLISLLYRANPAELGLILIDPKILELSVYEGIPHLRVPVVTDPRKAKAVLQWAVTEMDNRYRMMQKFGVRSIDAYNRMVKGETDLQPEENTKEELEQEEGIIQLSEDQIIAEGTIDTEEESDGPQRRLALPSEELKPLAKLVIVIDELADLMLTSGREVEEMITRLAQKARAAGIHIIIATQRPSVDVITGLIKANFPARLSFRVSSRIDSRTILDGMGAEKLLGRGDMLFMKPGAMHLARVHGSFVSDNEVKHVVNYIKERCEPCYDQRIIEQCEKALEEEGSSGGMTEDEEYDPIYDKAVAFVLEKGQASTSMIQRAFRIGYNRAARIVDTMEREGIVGPMDGAKPRTVLIENHDDDRAA